MYINEGMVSSCSNSHNFFQTFKHIEIFEIPRTVYQTAARGLFIEALGKYYKLPAGNTIYTRILSGLTKT